MIRISGIHIPNHKHVIIAMTAIYGIGMSRASEICILTGVSPSTIVRDLTEEEVEKLRNLISKYNVEGDLRREVSMSIKRLVDIGCYRGIRHKRGLPVRGQRTRTNARTRRGPKRGLVANKR